MLNEFFKLKEHGTDIATETRAGFTTFLTMVYIIPTNAIIMSKTGMPFDALITATALLTIFSTILVGIIGNAPIALSVGMGLNAYFTFGLVLGMKIPWESALGIVTISGLLFTILSIFKFREWILASIPDDLKNGMGVGIGAFLTFIALKEMNIIVDNPATLVSLGSFSNPTVLLGVLGIAINFALYALNVRAAFIISIAVVTIISFSMGYSAVPETLVSMPASISPIFMHLDIASVLHFSFIPVILAFLLTDMFDSIGTVSTAVRDIESSKEKQTSMLAKCLKVDAISTVIGGLAGLSTMTTFIESISGVKAGGRTGLTAVITGLFFISTLFFLPIWKVIPVYAVSPVLVAVGVALFANIQHVNFKQFESTAAVFTMIMLMVLTYSITNGLAAGFIVYFLIKLAKNEFRELTAGFYFITAISFIPFIFN